MKSFFVLFCVLAALPAATLAAENDGEPGREILVTFENAGASANGSNFRAPYRNRKRYQIAAIARRNADAISGEYELTEVDRWPIKSLSVYCIVYSVGADKDLERLIAELRADERVESVQKLQLFSTSNSSPGTYNDQYAKLQHGLQSLSISGAHVLSKGEGVRVAIIDSSADVGHEDLRGSIAKAEDFTRDDRASDERHGTAVASVIAARANNEVGIVGIAPSAHIDLLIACWAEPDRDNAICDSFSLARALDQLVSDPPDVLNMSLAGPHDPLLARIIAALLDRGVIVVAADPSGENVEAAFPARLRGVIAARSSGSSTTSDAAAIEENDERETVYAPGTQIMVALPDDAYDFRSGSSLAAAHVSGVIALLLAHEPESDREAVLALLRASQASRIAGAESIDACVALRLASRQGECPGTAAVSVTSKLDSGT